MSSNFNYENLPEVLAVNISENEIKKMAAIKSAINNATAWFITKVKGETEVTIAKANLAVKKMEVALSKKEVERLSNPDNAKSLELHIANQSLAASKLDAVNKVLDPLESRVKEAELYLKAVIEYGVSKKYDTIPTSEFGVA